MKKLAKVLTPIAIFIGIVLGYGHLVKTNKETALGFTVFQVYQGGTGSSSYGANYVLKGNGTSPIAKSGVSIDSGNNVSGISKLTFTTASGSNAELTGYASASKYFGAGLGNCSGSTALQFTLLTGLFSCSSSFAGTSPLGIQVNEVGSPGTHVGSISFTTTSFNVTNAASNSLVTLDYTNGPASRALSQTWTGTPTFSTGASASRLEITKTSGITASISKTMWVNGSNFRVGIGTSTPGTTLDVSGSASISSNFELPGTASISTATIQNFNGILNASLFPGNDIGVQTNAANTFAPASGSEIFIPTAKYTFSTPITLNTVGKKVLLKCAPGGVLTYTGANGTKAILFDPGAASVAGAKFNSANQGVDGCDLRGPGSNTSTVGIYVGGTNGANAATFSNNHIRDFGWGYRVDNNSYFDTWENNFMEYNSSSWQGIGTSNWGENMVSKNNKWVDCTLGGLVSPPYNPNKCFDTGTNLTSITMTGDSFDDSQLYIGPGSMVNLIGGHLEAPAGAGIVAYDRIKLASSSFIGGHINMEGTYFWVGNTATNKNQLIKAGNKTTVAAKNVHMAQAGSVTTMTSFITNDGTANISIDNVVDGGTGGGAGNVPFVTTSCINTGPSCNSLAFYQSNNSNTTFVKLGTDGTASTSNNFEAGGFASPSQLFVGGNKQLNLTSSIATLSIPFEVTGGYASASNIIVNAGTVGAPSVRLAGFNQTTGFYQSATGTIDVSINGVQKAEFNSNGTQIANGAASVPGIAFLGTTTGLFRIATPNGSGLGFSVATNEVATLRSSHASFSYPIFVIDSNTGGTTATASFNISANSLQSGTVASISGTALTTGNFAKFTVPNSGMTGKILLIQRANGNPLASISANGDIENWGYASVSGQILARTGLNSTTIPALTTGANANVSDWGWSFAGGRGMFGYDGTNVLINSGSTKEIGFKVNGTNGTWNSGTVAMQMGFADGTSGVVVGSTVTKDNGRFAIVDQTAQPAASASFIINGNSTQTGSIASISGGGLTTGKLMQFTVPNSGMTGQSLLLRRANGTALASISANGDLELMNGAYASSSVYYGAKITSSNNGNYLCWNTSTFIFEQNVTACLVSKRAAKTDIKDSPYGLTDLLKLPDNVLYHYKPDFGDGGTVEHIGLIADDVALALPKLGVYDKDGKISGYDPIALTDLNTQAIKDLNMKVDNLPQSSPTESKHFDWALLGLLGLFGLVPRRKRTIYNT